MEQVIKNIVVGYDFSPQAKDALGASLGIARATGATVHVLTALPGHIDREVMRAATTGAVQGRDQLYSKQAVMENLEGRVMGVVQELGAAGVTVRCEVSADKPLPALLDLSDLYAADLVMVGNTGLDAVERLFIGSTSQKLVRKSRFPVLIVKGGQPWPPRQILCPIDFSDASRRALGWAGELAGYTGAQVHLLNVREEIPSPYLEIYGVHYEPREEDKLNYQTSVMAQLQEFCDIPDMKGVSWTAHIDHGRVDECIVRAAQEVEADLICMGSVGRSGLENVLVGNTAERLLRQLPCSLLTVKPDEFSLHG
jgi:universal stress protein E